MPHDADDLTPDERAALDALPQGRVGSADLEERVVAALRERGLVGARARATSSVGRRLTATAAGVVLFVAGVAVGRRTSPAPAKVADARDTTHVAAFVQRIGSEYVSALSLASARTDSAHRDAIRQVAQSTLRAAATQVARVAPDDPIANGILRDSIDVKARGARGTVILF